ncbi:MAG TPA: isoprenylcysteine carboxylmethyltransferase family protein [Xanthomonadaceae bacterium]|nr:isoprenylcysteine carboxylmethyltransferase family protein [Xanthomonadaceae bacterium]
MSLSDTLDRCGNWLFRWRAAPPLLALVLLMLHLGGYRHLGGSKRIDDLWQAGCLLLALLGLALRAHVVGHAPKDTSGRNAREQRAASLNTTGLYSVVRHPLYAGNFLIYLGTVAFTHDPWPAAVCLLGYWLYYVPIMHAEESFLRATFGAQFADWARRTPAIVPALHGWRPPALPFSRRNVLRREYNNVFSVLLAMFLLDAASESAARGHFALGPAWSCALAAGFLAWLVLRTLKRHTEVLRVAGR